MPFFSFSFVDFFQRKLWCLQSGELLLSYLLLVRRFIVKLFFRFRPVDGPQ